MNQISHGNGNGNGNGAKGLLEQPKKQAAQPSAGASAAEARKSRVTFQTRDGLKLHGTPARVTRHQAVFELYHPAAVPRFSEALDQFQITLQGRTVYSGRAVVRNVVDAGTKIVCEATLDEAQWTDLNLVLALQKDGQIAREFKSFLKDWQKFYKVSPEFKIVIADMQTFLQDLRFWLERVELGMQALPVNEQKVFEQEVMKKVGALFVPAFDALHERLEAISRTIDEDLHPAHRIFAQRQLHPLMLCSPFARRAYEKPLGYAGDYEVMNMIYRNTFEGKSLYAKIVHFWFIKQWAAESVRNRIAYMKRKLLGESTRAVGKKHNVRILNLGCGPAREVQDFLSECRLANHAEFYLVDFDAETVNYVTSKLAEIKTRDKRTPTIQVLRKSVTQLLREASLPLPNSLGGNFDLIYSGGLFDYLSDQICKRLVSLFYEWLALDGLLVVANMNNQHKPFHHMVEYLLDWNLIYRDASDMAAFAPENAEPDGCKVFVEPAAVNLFLEVRKLEEKPE
jgi:extracellular factor (EF) 3-hydroxypalmitic acid methyl ester biosynthesis protein